MDYTTLKSVIADYANRQDLETRIPTFIELTEARLNRDIRHWRMVKRAEAPVVGERFPLPCDWLQTIKVRSGVSRTWSRIQGRSTAFYPNFRISNVY